MLMYIHHTTSSIGLRRDGIGRFGRTRVPRTPSSFEEFMIFWWGGGRENGNRISDFHCNRAT